MTKYFKILGVRINATNIDECKKSINIAITNNDSQYFILRDVHGLIQSRKSKAVKEAHVHASHILPDGMPLVWIGKWKGFKNVERCYGPDLMLAVMKESAQNGYKHFFYGGKPGVAKDLKSAMVSKFPGVNVVGTYSPPFRTLNKPEELELETLVENMKPDIIWIGLSTPKQEIFMYEYLGKLNTKLMIGVGAAFDFHTGHIKQAPLWIQRSGFEWLYRLIQEPRRLWKRYLIIIPTFVILLLLEITGLKRFD